MALLKRGRVPPYPQFYELLFTYVTGVDPALNVRINALLADGSGAWGELAERLYNEFLATPDVSERLNSVSRMMSDKIESVHVAIDNVMATANAYSGSLQTAHGDLDGELDQQALKALAARMIAETRRMQQANELLESTLQSSREDIATLQRDLDAMRRESMTDALTRIYNRKSFDEGLARAIRDAGQTGTPLSLMLLDIDHFKSFNDSWGHQTGDQVLRLVAMALQSNIKGRDMAARYGGEEFAVILPDTGLQGAFQLAEHIRKTIQAKELVKRSTNEKLGRITASFGVAEWIRDETAAALVERADRCLYAAKDAGRNQVVGDDSTAATGQDAA